MTDHYAEAARLLEFNHTREHKIAHALLALHDLLDARLPAAHPDDVPERPTEHEHAWSRHQNVTTKGHVMPACETCDCGEARPADDLLAHVVAAKVKAERDEWKERAHKAEAAMRDEVAEHDKTRATVLRLTRERDDLSNRLDDRLRAILTRDTQRGEQA